MLMFSRKQGQYRQSSWMREHDIVLIETRYCLRLYWTEGAKVSDSFWGGGYCVHTHYRAFKHWYIVVTVLFRIFQVPHPKCCVHQDGGSWPARLLLWPSHQSHLPQTCYQGNLLSIVSLVFQGCSVYQAGHILWSVAYLLTVWCCWYYIKLVVLIINIWISFIPSGTIICSNALLKFYLHSCHEMIYSNLSWEFVPSQTIFFWFICRVLDSIIHSDLSVEFRAWQFILNYL